MCDTAWIAHMREFEGLGGVAKRGSVISSNDPLLPPWCVATQKCGIDVLSRNDAIVSVSTLTKVAQHTRCLLPSTSQNVGISKEQNSIAVIREMPPEVGMQSVCMHTKRPNCILLLLCTPQAQRTHSKNIRCNPLRAAALFL
jgi:hypothetical protein